MAYATQSLSPDAFLRICPSRLLLSRIGEKWALMAIVALANGPLRFGGLMRRLEGISQKMLSQTLRNLERDGLLHREAFDVMPLRVDYSLTDRGSTLVPLAKSLKSWAEENLRAIEQNNRDYDAQDGAKPLYQASSRGS
jgi:DNA-binding HxlR family transcriptional regulator